MPIIRKIPIPAGALALGLASLGNLLGQFSPVARAVCGVLSAALVVALFARFAFDWPAVSAELRTPPALAVLPATLMALMQLATYLKPLAPGAATVIWSVAVIAQLLVSALFIWRFVFKFSLAQVLPSWFLIFVGFVVASVTSPAFGMVPAGRALLVAGSAGYAIALPLVAWRLVKLGDVPAPALGTLGIVAAPPSLLLVGYLAVVEAKQPVVVYALLALAAASLLFVSWRLPAILRAGFSPALSGLTFPLVISAIAFKQSGAFLAKTGTPVPALGAIAPALAAIATLAVAYVFVRYVLFLASPAPVVQPAPAS